ncbi:hypothetical protein UVI_02050890 [Ustilaginoidea virens]|uniref:GAT domain-containing protein n=1 Tax=Ustilaginoidea virens TaxID=1159556 RepID=A0A1B5L2C0_USTVR|nr:hypothetical protein UVI_02050890 [Ustilaginoidea virens]
MSQDPSMYLENAERPPVGSASGPSASAATPAENPEVTAHNSVSNEVLFLPPIVDAAESSPAAAAECARVIRKYLSKDYTSKPSWQYNAIMLVRILTDNPGETFTRNLDDKFIDTIRALLKNVKDRSVWQLLMETLDDFEHTKTLDENLAPLVLMWKREKEAAIRKHGARAPPTGPRPPAMSQPPDRHMQNYFAKAHHNNRLPDPVELTSRLEEARTSAKLLEQVVMNTPPGEMLQNELIREFADRCLSASRSLQGYMVSENPSPDNDTMESLIDTNEQLQTALNQHKRAVLNARKQLGLGASPADDARAVAPDHSENESQQRSHDVDAGLMSGGASTGDAASGKGKQGDSHDQAGRNGTAVGSSSRQSPTGGAAHDPFADPGPLEPKHAAQSCSEFGPEVPREPFHAGFGGPLSSHSVVVNGVGDSNSSNSRGGIGRPRAGHNRPLDASDEDDIYDATPKGKGPVERH